MRTTNLEYFKFAVDAGSLTRAASVHGVKVSTISRAIDRLEDELGVTLLERNRTGVCLTPAGELLFEKITSLLHDLERIKTTGQLLGRNGRNVIHVGSLLPPIGDRFRLALSRWKIKHPKVRIIFHEMGARDLLVALSRRQLDAIFFAPFVRFDEIESLPFCDEELFLALPTEHPLHHYQSLSPDKVRNETFLIQDWGQDHSVRDRYAEILGTDVAIETHPVGKQCVFALVGAGYGVTLAARSQAECGFPGVVFRPLAAIDARLQILLGWDASCQDAMTGRFISFIRDLDRQS
ncbi:LysR family transcriptional regulator [Komagataeibacter xylinus]|uniref:LysR family transcriptional regulator n=1 Tax=Komagataeibacter xylinus TaxID=28448 RepID=UPI00280C19DA|nr:LysR family transcriptional regulator [Komagataeibacter xylinus]